MSVPDTSAGRAPAVGEEITAGRHQRICAWAGIIFLPLFLIGLLIAGFIPPPSPHMTATATEHMFISHRLRIRIGVWLLTASTPLLALFAGALTHQVREIAGERTPLTFAQLAASTVLILEFIFPQMIWQAAAYRPTQHGAQIVQTLNDVAWLMYIGVVSTAMLQMLIIGYVILTDRRERPVLPRWLGYLNLWTTVGILSGGLCVFVKSGPIAWNGILAFWILAVSFFIWIIATGLMMIRATRDGTPGSRPR